MILILRALFVVVFASMVWVTSWASLHQALGDFVRGPVIRDPWVIATLFDAYWAFVAFYVWVAWKEQSTLARLLWFISLIALGNLAIAAYMLSELFRVPATGQLDTVFTRRNAGSPVLPGILTGITVAVYLLA